MNENQSVFECARVPKGKKCSVQLTGQRDDVVEAAKQHMASVHEHTNDAQLGKDVTRAVDTGDYDSWGG